MKRQTVIVFGGGNALGAYHAGAYEGISSRGIEPDWIVGASVGAITGAILAGNRPEHRLERLRAFWSEATIHTPSGRTDPRSCASTTTVGTWPGPP